MNILTKVIEYESIKLVAKFALAISTNNFIIGFNSLNAYASVNHLHFHFYYLINESMKQDKPLPIQNVTVNLIFCFIFVYCSLFYSLLYLFLACFQTSKQTLANNRWLVFSTGVNYFSMQFLCFCLIFDNACLIKLEVFHYNCAISKMI